MSSYVDLLEEYRKKFDREIFPLLISNQLIHKNTGRVYHSFQKRIDRIELQKKSIEDKISQLKEHMSNCLLYTSPSPRDATLSRMPSSA